MAELKGGDYGKLVALVCKMSGIGGPDGRTLHLQSAELGFLTNRLPMNAANQIFAGMLIKDLENYGTLKNEVKARAHWVRYMLNVQGWDPEDRAFLIRLAEWPEGAAAANSPQNSAESNKASNENHILFLSANPDDADSINNQEEYRAIDRVLQQGKCSKDFQISVGGAVRANDINSLMLRHTPNIVHFSGHGSKNGDLMMVGNNGLAQPMSVTALSGMFGILNDDPQSTQQVQLVVLNACYSAAQAEAIVKVVDIVVGMGNAIGDGSAIRFAEGFYEALGFGRSVQAAFDLAKSKVTLTGLPNSQVPQLLARKGIDPAHYNIFKC
jgi:hypothetical protein